MASTDNKHNRIIIDAKKNAVDEFYTTYDTVENELSHYIIQFADKIVYCNCDDPDQSNFVKYFTDNFKQLRLKRLFATSLSGKFIDYDGEHLNKQKMTHCDMFDDFCVGILRISDIIVTNPPFSRFVDLIDLLLKHDKKFLLIGNNNAITHKRIFPHFINREIWLGVTLFTGTFPYFIVPDKFTNIVKGHYKEINGIKYKQVNNICWFTNIISTDKYGMLCLDKCFDETYTTFDDNTIVNIDLVKNIPHDYCGEIGVPLTILKYLHDDGFIHCYHGDDKIKYCIVGCMCRNKIDEYNRGYPIVNGKRKFVRIIIKINN